MISPEQMRVDAIIARFPARFCLAGFGDSIFAISRGQETKKGIILFLAIREPRKDPPRFVIHKNGVSTKVDFRSTSHGRISPEDLRILIQYADTQPTLNHNP